jgi:polyisoprenoid-binding protein YceI
MRNKLLFAVTAVALSLAGASVSAQTSTWTIDPAHSSVNFTIRHMGVSNVHGSLSGIKGTVNYNEKDITKSSVENTIDAATISTGVEARDKHLKSPDFFDVEKYPTISFKTTSIKKTDGKLQLIGDLTLHGVTKSITLDVDGPAPAQSGPNGKTISGFSAEGTIHRSDFGIGHKFGAAMIGEDVKFSIDVEIDKQ